MGKLFYHFINLKLGFAAVVSNSCDIIIIIALCILSIYSGDSSWL